jgi:hypothetical protein
MSEYLEAELVSSLTTLLTCALRKLVRLYGDVLIPHTDAMDDIGELRRIIGSTDKEYNNVQLRLLSRELDLTADFLLDLYAYEEQGIKMSDRLTEAPPSVGLK